MGIILQPFAWLLLFFYNLFNSYGLALILFGIIVKLVLFPVTLKSKKSMIQTTMLSGKMQQLQKQYGKDRERYNLEVQKLYEREKVNPMGGCIWSLIPMIVLIALYGIIREPLTYFMQMSAEQIQVLAAQLDWQTLAVANNWVSQANMDKLIQQMAEKVTSGELTVLADGLWKSTKDGAITGLFQNGGFNQLHLLAQVTNENLASLKEAVNAQLAGGADHLFVLNFMFLGIDLSLVPTLMFWKNGFSWGSIGLFLLPLISVAVSTLNMKVSQVTNQMNNQSKNEQMDKTNKMMMWMMPLMSLWIGFTIPAGLTVYWIAQYFVGMAQEVICGRMLKKDYEAAREASARREAEEKEEEKRRKEEARLERQRRLEEEKKNRGKKKEKKDAEPDQEGVNKEDSREGIRAYARGRSYIPGRYGGVTPYTDPNQLFRAMEAVDSGKKKKKKGQEENPEGTTQAGSIQIPEHPPAEPAAPVEETAAPAPVETPAETEEVEVEVEEIEVEVDEDENKEG